MLFIGWSNTFLFAQSEDEYFQKAGYEYYKADYPKAHKFVMNGLEKYNSSEKLNKLKELICEKWTGCEGTSPPLTPPCNDRDGDGICDEDDVCPDDPDNTCNERYTEPGCMDRNAINYDPDATEDCCCDYDVPPPPPLPVRGCMDPNANNYDSYATENCCCTYEVPEPIVRGCTDRSAINYNSNATDNCCCKYQQKIDCRITHVQLQPRVSWSSQLARAADNIEIQFKVAEGRHKGLQKTYGVSGQTFHDFHPQDSRFGAVNVTVTLIFTIDLVKYKVENFSKCCQKFNCN